MNDQEILSGVSAYYTGKLDTYGATPAGVDWNSAESQQLRFEQLLALREDEASFSINDYGCGYGALVDRLRDEHLAFEYTGFDISDAMIARARERHASCANVTFVSDATTLKPAEYTVASGIFNVKLNTPVEVWEAFVLSTLERLAALSKKGFAFNMLTSYSDPERMRPDLYYADPCFIFDHCKRRFSKWIALLHDYGLYEFTVLVRRRGEPEWLTS